MGLGPALGGGLHAFDHEMPGLILNVIMKSPRFPGLNSSSMVMVEFSSSFEPGQGELVPVFGGESLTDSGMEDWDIALWLQSLEQSQLCLPF